MTTVGKGPACLVVGYLTNVYPAVSHSFIKREILALEALGVTIRRWSIRPCAADLPDPSDQAEAERTEVILARKPAVLLAAAKAVLLRPRRAWRTIGKALEGRPAGLRAAVVRLAHFAEACYLAERAKAAGVQHIHAHFGTNPASVARLAHAMGGPPFSFTVHGPDEFDAPQLYALGAKIAEARFAVAISRYGRSQLMRWSRPADWSKLHVVRCGLDAQFLAEPAEQRGAASEPPTFSCVARLAPQKGLPVLVAAAALLHEAGQQFRIVIVGDGELRQSLEGQLQDLGLAPCFELLGWQSASVVQDVILRSRAFVLPSFAEGLPVAIMEALALRRPVISTRIAGIPELVDEQCGWLIDAGDAPALAKALSQALAADPAALDRLGETGRQRVLADHDISRSADALHRLLTAAVQGQTSC